MPVALPPGGTWCRCEYCIETEGEIVLFIQGALDSEGKPVDAAFYRTFWGLQTFFSNPQVALQPGKWGEVSRDIKRVLDKFRQEKVTVGESAAVASGAAEGVPWAICSVSGLYCLCV
jgi:hypothetical protein